MIRKKKPRRLTPIISNKIPVVFNFLNKKISPENNTVIKRDRLSPIQFTNNITRGLQSSRVKNIKKNICNKYRKKVLISFVIRKLYKVF